MTELYVYALVEERIRKTSAGGRRLEAVPAGGFFAIVERVDATPPVTEHALRAQHAIVAGLAERVDAILPARFGALIDLRELDAVVRAGSGTLREAFDLVRGREQMTVRLFGAVPRSRKASGRPARGRDYLLRRARAGSVADRLRDSVQALIAGERLERGREGTHFSIHHLVARGESGRYRSLAGRALAHLPSPAEVRVSGPWPPYAFVPGLWK